MRARRSARRSVRPGPALAGLLLAAALALSGCSSGGDGGGAGFADKAVKGDAREAAPDTGGGSGRGAASDAKATAPPRIAASHIIRTASLSVQVKDVPKALDAARTATENAGGYVGNETTSRDEDGHTGTRVVLRVPVDRYDEVLADLEGTGKLLDRTAKAQDVTGQVVDVESRIKSQRASVARVRALMDQATGLSDVVVLEGELSRREADLEALLAQQASLKDRTSMATITLSLSQTPEPEAAADDDRPGFVDALAGGWRVFVTLLHWFALAVGAVLPFAAAAALVAVVWLRLVRPRLPRRPAHGTAPVPAPVPAPATPEPAGEPGGERD